MIYRDMMSIASVLMTWGIIFLVNYFSGNDKLSNFNKYGTIVVLILSVAMLVWLPLNKELFHWNYDRATGERVDHYSTYKSCATFTLIAFITSAINIVVRIIQKKKNG